MQKEVQEKKIEDYLHLYIGCDCTFEEILVGKINGIFVNGNVHIIHNHAGIKEYHHCSTVRPHFRPLSDITPEERFDFQDVMPNVERVEGFIDFVITPERVRWLLSKHFDLFGLIDAGLAIDKTKP